MCDGEIELKNDANSFLPILTENENLEKKNDGKKGKFEVKIERSHLELDSARFSPRFQAME